MGTALVAFGCSDPQGGTDVGNGAAVALDLVAYQQDQQQTQGVTLYGGSRVDVLWMVVDRIRFRPGVDCSSDDDAIDVEGPLLADLIGDGVLGGSASFPVAPGSFCRLRLDFHPLEGAPPTAAPADLAGRSLLMKGARADGTPFTVASTLNEEFELRAADGAFDLPAGQNPLFLAYALDPWMVALDLATLPGPAIVISDDENAARLEAFEEALKLSARLFRDADGNGALSSSERAAGTELADSAGGS